MKMTTTMTMTNTLSSTIWENQYHVSILEFTGAKDEDGGVDC